MNQSDVLIIDYGVGNIASVVNMLQRIGYTALVSSSADDVKKAKKIILPGVGSYDAGMSNLQKSGLVGSLSEKVLNHKIPILGICLGSQLLGRSSEEGKEKGLGWIDMDVVRFPSIEGLKVPHMGWNFVSSQKQTPLSKDLDLEARFYFVHSYYMKPDREETTLLKAHYGIDFAAGVSKDNIFGLQFHPEKSHKFGMNMMKRFMEIDNVS